MRSIGDLILFGSDAEVRAAAEDPTRPKVSAAQAAARLREILPRLGISAAVAIAALTPKPSAL